MAAHMPKWWFKEYWNLLTAMKLICRYTCFVAEHLFFWHSYLCFWGYGKKRWGSFGIGHVALGVFFIPFFPNSYGVERHRYLAHEESSSNYKRSGVKIDHFTNSELANASGSLSCRTWIEPANQFIRNGALWPLFLLCVRLCSSTRTARLGLLWKSAVFNSNRHLTKDLGLLLNV